VKLSLALDCQQHGSRSQSRLRIVNLWQLHGSKRIPGEPAESEIPGQWSQPFAGALAEAFLTISLQAQENNRMAKFSHRRVLFIRCGVQVTIHLRLPEGLTPEQAHLVNSEGHNSI
jgi:hypothetical protein